MVGDDTETLKEIISIFIEESPETLKSLRESVESRDFERLKSVTHSLATELAMLGVTSIVNDVKIISKSGSEMDNLDETVDKIVKTVVYSVEYFKTII